MPWTTLDSILKRGIANSNITNVLKNKYKRNLLSKKTDNKSFNGKNTDNRKKKL